VALCCYTTIAIQLDCDKPFQETCSIRAGEGSRPGPSPQGRAENTAHASSLISQLSPQYLLAAVAD